MGPEKEKERKQRERESVRVRDTHPEKLLEFELLVSEEATTRLDYARRKEKQTFDQF